MRKQHKKDYPEYKYQPRRRKNGKLGPTSESDNQGEGEASHSQSHYKTLHLEHNGGAGSPLGDLHHHHHHHHHPAGRQLRGFTLGLASLACTEPAEKRFSHENVITNKQVTGF